MRRALCIWFFLAVAAFVAFALALTAGSVRLSPPQVLHALLNSDTGTGHEIITKLRLPRALAAFATGGLLALAGALMQVLLRNPLADPYVLGLSGGAAVGALGFMLAGLGTLAVDAGAAVGAWCAMLLVFGLAHRDFGRAQGVGTLDTSPQLLLIGVVMAAGWGAVITLMLTLAPEGKVRGMLFWLIGDLNGADIWLPGLIALPLCFLVAYPAARDLNLMLRGETMAHALGVDVRLLRRRVYFVASIATAFAVTTAGTIGFVGLLVPHAMRLSTGNDQRLLLPACVLAGGTLLLFADTVARTVLAPQQIPVGVVMALIGVPTFMLLLTRDHAKS